MSSRPDSINPGTAVNRYGESVGRNTRILRDLNAKLSSSNQEEYVEAASKLAKWLLSDKAYYQEVRPQIVTILETAAYTLASLLGLKLANDFHISRCTTDLQPRVEAFISLVQAVKPFLSLFPEEQLKSRLVNVFAMIYISPPESQDRRESVLTRSLSEVSTTAIMKVLAASSSRISPATPLSSSPPANNPDAYSTHGEHLADQFTARRPSLRASQPSPSKNYSAARSTASGNLSTSPTTSTPKNTPLSVPILSTPHAPISISRAFRLRKAHFPGQDPQSEDAPPTTAPMMTQSVQSGNPAEFPAAPSNLSNLRTESTIIARPHVFSPSTQPIIPVPTQQHVSRCGDPAVFPAAPSNLSNLRTESTIIARPHVFSPSTQPIISVPTQQHVSRCGDPTVFPAAPSNLSNLRTESTIIAHPHVFSPSTQPIISVPTQQHVFRCENPVVFPGSMTTQSVQSGDPAVFPAPSSNLCNLRTGSTIVLRPPVFSPPTQPIIPVPTQQHVSPSNDTLGANSPTTMAPLKPASLALNAIGVPATINERRWKNVAQSQGAIQAAVHTEQAKELNDSDIKAAQAVSVAPAATVLISYEEGKGRASSSARSTTDSRTTISYQPSSLAVDDVRSVAASRSMDRMAVPTQLTQETRTHLLGMTRSESTQHMPAEKLSLYSQNLEASGQGKCSIGQQGVYPPCDAGQTSKGETLVLSGQGKANSPHSPCSEVDVSMRHISEDQTDQGPSPEVLGANSASDAEAGEVARIAVLDDETGRSASVAASSHIAEVQTGDRRAGSHVHANEMAQYQPALAPTSFVEEDTGNSAIQVPPVVPTSSLSEPSAHGEGPSSASTTSALQTSPTNLTTSMLHVDDPPAQADTTHAHPVPIPAIKFGSNGITMDKDAHRDASSVVTQNMQEPHGNAGQERLVAVDDVKKHFSAQLEPLSGTGAATPVMQAGAVKPLPREEKKDKENMSEKVEASHAAQSESAKDEDGDASGKQAASERDREKNLPLEKDVKQALLGGSGKKRPRSSSEEAISEPPSNKARRVEQEREKTEDIVAVSLGESAEDSGDGKEVASLLTSSAATPIREERVAGETDPSGEACVDVEKYASFKAPSEYGSAFHVDSLGLPLCSYHPTQPYTTIAIVAGSHMGDTQDVRFELDEEQAMLVKRWTDRFEGLDTPCISITLICTHVPDSQSLGSAEEVAEEDTTQKLIRWPSGGKFWVTVEADGRPPVSISVSPPDLIEAHEPLDVSSLVGRGLTTMRFMQLADHAGYRFVLRAHRPTAAQLFALDGAGMAERTFMAGFGAPLPESLRRGLFSPPGAK